MTQNKYREILQKVFTYVPPCLLMRIIIKQIRITDFRILSIRIVILFYNEKQFYYGICQIVFRFSKIAFTNFFRTRLISHFDSSFTNKFGKFIRFSLYQNKIKGFGRKNSKS